MENSLALFQQFRPMIEGYVWKSKRKYKQFERDDLQSQAFLLFCQAYKKFDPNRKTKFSTVLYNELRRLNDYCKVENRKKVSKKFTIINVSNNKDYLKGFDNYYKIVSNIFYNTYKDKREQLEKEFEDLPLSDDAKYILAAILSYEWNVPGYNRKPSYHSLQRDFNFYLDWSKKRTGIAWNEIKKWWNSKGYIEFSY
jgi:hypothetical protein